MRVSESVLVVCVGFVLVCAFDLTRLASLLPSALSLVWCVVCAPGCVSLYLSVTLALLINYFLSTLKSTSGVGFGFGREESCCSELLDTRSLLAQRAEHAPTTRSSSGAPTHPRVPRTTSNSSLLRRHSLCRPISVAIIFVPSPLHAHIHRSSPLSPLPPLWHRVYFKSASPPVRFSSSLPPSITHPSHTHDALDIHYAFNTGATTRAPGEHRHTEPWRRRVPRLFVSHSRYRVFGASGRTWRHLHHDLAATHHQYAIDRSLARSRLDLDPDLTMNLFTHRLLDTHP